MLQHTTIEGYRETKNSRDRHTATHFNTLQHTATHCNTLQHAATHCNMLQHTTIEGDERQRVQETDTNCNARCREIWVLFSRWVLQHCTGFARLVWGRLRVHRAFIYSNWFVCSVCRICNARYQEIWVRSISEIQSRKSNSSVPIQIKPKS